MRFYGEERIGVFNITLIESALARPKQAAVYENAENLPLMSCGDVKLMLGNILKNKLDEPEILMQTIHQRHKVRRDDILRRKHFLI